MIKMEDIEINLLDKENTFELMKLIFIKALNLL